MKPDPDLRACSNLDCPIRTSCGRISDLELYTGEPFTFPGSETLGGCRGFVVRKALGGGGNTDIVFGAGRSLSQSRRRGRRHNAHAGVRESYPGSEALFGKIFGGGKKSPRNGPRMGFDISTASLSGTTDGFRSQVPSLPRKPDLMVKRHIHKGRDINNPEEQE